MRKLTIILTSFLFCLPLFVYSDNSSDYYDYSFARMSYVTGDVFIERAADLGYEQGIVNLPVVENDKLGTRDGRTEIHFGKKNYLRIDRYTHIDFAGLPRKGYDQVRLNLLSGNIYLRVSFLGREKDFEVHTPDASFYVLEEGLYQIKVVENSETEIHVLEGTIEAAGEEGSVLVEAEERLVASNGVFRAGPEYLYASYSDDFSQWNNSRDDLLFRTLQKTYLPSELYEYESELATNGRWVHEGSYGYVWVPHVYHNTWRPYHYGRWLWYPICGWTWVPYASWGWCVSHYGRWHWRFGLGWYWIPRCSWGPAWVHWYHGHDYYAWCPVSYWGYPVVIQNNYFYGHWNDRYYPVHSRALTVIHKNQLQAPRISKVALSRSHANRLGKISLSAKQPGVRGVAQRNSLTSQKASKVLARSNIRKVGKSFSSSQAIRSTSRSSPVKSTGKTFSGRTTGTSSGKAGVSKNSISRSTSRTAIKTYSPRSISSKDSKSSVTNSRVSRSSATYPSRMSKNESVKTSSRNQYPSRNLSSQNTRIERSSSPQKSTHTVKMYPSRISYSYKSSSKSYSNRYSSTSRSDSEGTSSYSKTSRYSSPSRYSSSPESRSSSSSYSSSRSVRPSSSYRSSSSRGSSPSAKSSYSYRASPSRSSQGSISSRSSSSSSRSTKSYTRSNSSSSSSRASSSKVSSSRSSSPSRSRSSSGSKSIKSVSKSSTKIKRK